MYITHLELIRPLQTMWSVQVDVKPMTIYIPTRMPTSLFPHMCLWNEDVLSAPINALVNNGVSGMAVIYLLLVWQLFVAHQERKRK